MSEVMVHSPVEESFFPESKFNNSPKSKITEMSSLESSEFKENYIHKDTPVENNIEDTNCKSDAEVSPVKNAHTSDFNDLKNDMKSQWEKIQKENVLGEEYEILTPKRTLVNTAYNVVTESTTREITDRTNNAENASWSIFSEKINEAVDKSRVIVQVLKSDQKSKTENVVETKSPSPENPVTDTFRDDLCKLLTASRLPKFDEDSNTGDTTITETFNATDSGESISSDKSDKKTHVSKGRRKRNLNLYFMNGCGMKISDLKCVSENLRQATPGTLRYLHYIMFSSFGLCGSGLQMIETKKNISGFCGYPFKRSSEQFKKKLSCLEKIPEQLLAGIHRAIFGKTTFFDRCVMVDQLLDFLLFPRKCSVVLKKYEDIPNITMDMPEEEYNTLKESAIKGPSLSIVLDKLSEGQIKNYTFKCSNGKHETSSAQSVMEDKDMEDEGMEYKDMEDKDMEDKYMEDKDMEDKDMGDKDKDIEDKNIGGKDMGDKDENETKPADTLPAFILNGPGTKLKYFSKIARNVRIIPEQSVKMFHYILYGRLEPSIEDCRRNILEFNGFSKCQQEFVTERKAVIKGLNQRELFELCQILCLRAKTNSREVRIKKVLKYLQSPSKPLRGKTSFKPEGYLWAVPMQKKAKEGFFPKRKYTRRFPSKRKTEPIFFKSSEFGIEKQDPILVEKRAPKGFFAAVEGLHNQRTSVSPIVPPVVPPDYPEDIFWQEGTKLRDHKTICQNIECAAPSDLIELNDLLFMKVCDETDIHQKILDCTKFKFPVNSFQYDCRKTLMHYMGLHVLRKIARLLNIENWDNITSHLDLSTSILKFLMEDKSQRSFYPKPSSQTKPVSENIHSDNSSNTTIAEFPESTLNHEIQKSVESECTQANQNSVPHTNNVIIHKLTKAPVQNQEMCQLGNNKALQIKEKERSDSSCANYLESDSLCLRELIHHPSEKELDELVHRLVQANLWDFTLGDLVKKVYECYPEVNLTYRESFIKATARQIISRWRDYAVNAVKDQSL